MKKFIIIITATFMGLFCIKCDKIRTPITPPNAYIDIAYKDSMGNDLLDATTLNHYSDIIVTAINKGNRINLYNPSEFFIYEDDSLKENLLRLSFLIRTYNYIDTIIIQLNENTIDTVTSDNQNGRMRNVWYNGVLKWKFEDGWQIITIKK